MLYVVRPASFTGLIVSVVLTVMACAPVNAPEDIQPLSPVEVQATPADSQPQPAVTGLPTEISIPQTSPVATPGPREIIEPVSPAPTGVEPAAAPADMMQPLPGSETALAAAKAHLAQQASVPAEQITLVSMEAREWSDASLGCPQEGMMYAQVITPGYLIILAVQGQQYEYHTDQATNVVLCPQ